MALITNRCLFSFAKGRFTLLAPSGSDDEVERVVGAFNHMTAELQKRQDQLVREKKLSSIGVLTSGVAHQLNNPLNNISTSCQTGLNNCNACGVTQCTVCKNTRYLLGGLCLLSCPVGFKEVGTGNFNRRCDKNCV